MVIARREELFARRSLLIAFGIGLALAMVSSGALVFQRLSGGGARSAFASNVLLAGVSVLALAFGSRAHAIALIVRAPRPVELRLRAAVIFVPQMMGAVAGILAIHGLLRFVNHDPWLSERPLQLVNDAVSAIVIATMLRACAARSFDFTTFAGGLLLLACYALTASRWHFDSPPRPLEISIQTLVLAQATSATVALFVARALRAD